MVSKDLWPTPIYLGRRYSCREHSRSRTHPFRVNLIASSVVMLYLNLDLQD